MKQNGDLQFEGAIMDYSSAPVSIQSGTDQAAKNRLTITVSVKYTNKIYENKNIMDNWLNKINEFVL